MRRRYRSGSDVAARRDSTYEERGDEPHVPVRLYEERGDEPHVPVRLYEERGDEPHVPVRLYEERGDEPHVPVRLYEERGDEPHVVVRLLTNGRIYADHAATTPVREEVAAAMLPYFTAHGNASSLHAEGRAARAAVDDARAIVADALDARPREIVFTSGGSEANSLAINGVARAAARRGGHVVSVATEHRAVLHAMEVLAADGFALTVLDVDGDGRVAPERFAAALRPDTILASVMLANNELGTVQPIAALARLARARNVLFHCDAVQAPGRVALAVDALGVDLLALSAHKFYGPKGVGALYVRSGTPLAAQIVGGGQEAGLRAGTENVAGIAGLACALQLAVAERPVEAARLARLRDRFEAAVLRNVSGSRVNAAATERLPNVSSLAFAGVAATELLVALDLAGAAVSVGSACAAGSAERSHVLEAIDAPRWAQAGTIRVSFGKLTSEEDAIRLAQMIGGVVPSLRLWQTEVGTIHAGPASGRSEVRS